MKKFIIICDGGFCNRLNSLLVGLLLSDALNVRPIVIWPKNDMCGADIRDVFIFPIFDVLDDYKSIPDEEWLHYAAIGHYKKIHCMSCVSLLSDYKCLSEMYDFYSMSQAGGYVYVSDYIPDFVSHHQVLTVLASLQFHPEILEQVEAKIGDWGAEDIYGVHLRATDHPGALSIEPVFNFARDMSDSLFFICSDDESVEDKFSQLPNVRINRKENQPNKQDVNRDWYYKNQDGTYHFNIVRNADVVMDGMIDLLLLSRTRLVCQPDIGSSYWSSAKLLNRLWHRNIPSGLISEPIPVYAYAAGSLLTDVINSANDRYHVVGIVDGDSRRWGQVAHGLTIEPPQVLLSHDYSVLICTYQLYAAYDYLKYKLGIDNKIRFLTHTDFF